MRVDDAVPAPPPEWVEYWDAVEDAELESMLVGDGGFADRVFGSWWADPDFGATDVGADDGSPGTPADPIELMGAANWLRSVATAHARSEARALAAVHAVAHHGGRRDQQGRPLRDEGGVDEVAVAMGWSRSMASARVTLAEAVIDRMPHVHAAMAQGALDLAKASAIARHTATMPDDLARAIAVRVVDRAPQLSCPDVAELIAGLAVELDADWARRRELAARAQARVEASRTVEGTADIALRDVGAEAGARMRARIEALAVPLRCAGRAQGLLVRGRPIGIALARAMVGQYLWDGSAAGLDDDALLRTLVRDLPDWLAELDDEPSGPDPDQGPDDQGPDDQGPDDQGPDDQGPDDQGPDDQGPDDQGPDDQGPDDQGPDDQGPDDQGPDDQGPDDQGPDDQGSDDQGEVWAGTVELRMRLSTALGLDELPGDLAGSGVLTAPTARAMLERAHRGAVPVECRLVLTDADGHLEHVLLVPLAPPCARPPGARRTPRRARGRVIVELAAPTTLLRALEIDRYPGWAMWLRRAVRCLARRLAAGANVGGARHPAVCRTDAARRFAGRELDRHVRVRDRRCVGPYCSAPAHGVEIDHTREWRHRGRTVAGNLGATCAHCHRLKTESGWRLEQSEPGRFAWRTPLGQVHGIAPRPVLTSPAGPVPRADGRPRPVRTDRPRVRTGCDGWIDRRPRAYLPAAVPAWSERSGTARADRDDPPPF